MPIPWTKIDTVLLDMDGTLLDLHFDSHFWLEHLPVRYAQIHDSEPKQAKDWLMQRLSKERGTIDWYCVDYWSDQLSVDIAALKREVKHNICYRPHAERFLELLNQSSQKVVLVTNDHRSSLEMKLELTGLAQYLDEIIVSHDFKVAKEHQDFWHKMQGIEYFEPDRTLFIDDTSAILDAAGQFGIKHLRLISQPDSNSCRKLQSPHRRIECFSTINASINLSV
jgi:putative hydrolase of the HAD superfamily